jgi:hypothetical protein
MSESGEETKKAIKKAERAGGTIHTRALLDSQ